METFTVTIKIYDLSMEFMVIPINNKPFCFKIKPKQEGANSMIINRLPDHSWNAECVTMKYFTDENIQRLGNLIECQKPELFIEEAVVE